MAEIYRLPAVSPTMETGLIVAWRMEVGQAFEAGAVLAEVGTDKATMEAEIFEDGVLLALLAEVDAEVPVDAPIAVYGAAGEDAAEVIEAARAELARLLDGGAAPAEPAGAPAPADTPAPVAAEAPAPEAPALTREAPAPADAADVVRTWRGRPLSTLFLEPPGDAGVGRPRGGVRASPAARKAAREAGVDLAGLRGSGPHGRVLRADIEARAAGRTSGHAAAPPPADRTIKLTPMRRTIAKRLTEVHQQVPAFTLNITLDMTAMVSLRAALKDAFPDDRVSYNDLLMMAVGRALRAVPEANASWTDQGIVEHGRVDVGMAVAVDAGLITPVIRDCDRKDARAIAAEARALAGKARSGKLLPEEYQGNTFTVSNLGMLGITRFTAILNPPASAILAVGALEQRPVVNEGALSVGWRMDVVMTCDHRVIDGAVGARFLQALRRHVEAPGLMAFGG